MFGLTGLILAPVIGAFYYGALEATTRADDTRLFWVPLYGTFFATPFLASSFYSFFWPVGFVLAMAPFLLMAMLAQAMLLLAR